MTLNVSTTDELTVGHSKDHSRMSFTYEREKGFTLNSENFDYTS